MQTEIVYENFLYKYHLIDLSLYDPYEFLNSDIPEEIIMAILAGKLNQDQARLLIKKILTKLHMLLDNNISELKRKIGQLETLSGVKKFQNLIIEEEQNMPFILDETESVPFLKGVKTGLEQGVKTGIAKATEQRNTTFIKNLLLKTSHSIEEISDIVDVPVSFVQKVKSSLQ